MMLKHWYTLLDIYLWSRIWQWIYDLGRTCSVLPRRGKTPRIRDKKSNLCVCKSSVKQVGDIWIPPKTQIRNAGTQTDELDEVDNNLSTDIEENACSGDISTIQAQWVKEDDDDDESREFCQEDKEEKPHTATYPLVKKTTLDVMKVFHGCPVTMTTERHRRTRHLSYNDDENRNVVVMNSLQEFRIKSRGVVEFGNRRISFSEEIMVIRTWEVEDISLFQLETQIHSDRVIEQSVYSFQNSGALNCKDAENGTVVVINFLQEFRIKSRGVVEFGNRRISFSEEIMAIRTWEVEDISPFQLEAQIHSDRAIEQLIYFSQNSGALNNCKDAENGTVVVINFLQKFRIKSRGVVEFGNRRISFSEEIMAIRTWEVEDISPFQLEAQIHSDRAIKQSVYFSQNSGALNNCKGTTGHEFKNSIICKIPNSEIRKVTVPDINQPRLTRKLKKGLGGTDASNGHTRFLSIPHFDKGKIQIMPSHVIEEKYVSVRSEKKSSQYDTKNNALDDQSHVVGVGCNPKTGAGFEKRSRGFKRKERNLVGDKKRGNWHFNSNIAETRLQEDSGMDASNVTKTRLQEESGMDSSNVTKTRLHEDSGMDASNVTKTRLQGYSGMDASNVTKTRLQGDSGMDASNVTKTRLQGDSGMDASNVTKTRLQEESGIDALQLDNRICGNLTTQDERRFQQVNANDHCQKEKRITKPKVKQKFVEKPYFRKQSNGSDGIGSCFKTYAVTVFTLFFKDPVCWCMVVLMLLPTTAADPKLHWKKSARNVTHCPTTKEEWLMFSTSKDCSTYLSEPQPQYHCVLNDDRTGFVELCAPVRKILGEFCTEYNRGLEGIQPQTRTSCKGICPFAYNSTDMINYPECYNLSKIYDSTDSELPISTAVTKFQENSTTVQQPSKFQTSRYTCDACSAITITYISICTCILLFGFGLYKYCKVRRPKHLYKYADVTSRVHDGTIILQLHSVGNLQKATAV